MKKSVLWISGMLVAFILFLLAKLPAAQVVYRLPLPSNIAITGVSGTLWSGYADQISVDGLPFENVEWELSALALLFGSADLDIRAGDMRDSTAAVIQGPLKLSLFNTKQIEAEDLLVYLPTNPIIAQAKLPIRVNMGGRFRLRLEKMAFDEGCEVLQGFGEWLNASVSLPKSSAQLGSLTSKLSCQGQDIQIEVKEPNKLGLSFISLLSADFKKFTINGKFKPDSSLPKEIHQAGQFFGTPDDDGYITLDL